MFFLSNRMHRYICVYTVASSSLGHLIDWLEIVRTGLFILQQQLLWASNSFWAEFKGGNSVNLYNCLSFPVSLFQLELLPPWPCPLQGIPLGWGWTAGDLWSGGTTLYGRGFVEHQGPNPEREAIWADRPPGTAILVDRWKGLHLILKGHKILL